MQGFLRVICLSCAADAVCDKAIEFVSSAVPGSEYVTSVTPYYKDEECSVIEVSLTMDSFDRDTVTEKMKAFTGRASLESVDESECSIDIGSYVSIDEMTPDGNRFFCTLYINKSH